MIEYGIAFLLNEKINNKAFQIVQELKLKKENLQVSIDDNFLPHISLYQGVIKELDLNNLKSEIQKNFINIIEINMKTKLEISKYSSNIFWNSENNTDLQNFHLQILSLGKKYSQNILRTRTKEDLEKTTDPEIKKYLLENHSIYFGKNYLPHITLAKIIENNQPLPNLDIGNYSFIVNTIFVGKINSRGQMNKTDELFRITI